MKADLLDRIATDVSEELGGGLWSGPKVTLFMNKEYGVEISRKKGWQLLRECDYTITTIRQTHKRSDATTRDTFKKNVS